MKKWIIGLVLVLILGYGGYRYGMHVVSGKVMDKLADQVLSSQEIEQMKHDPEIRKVIEQNLSPEEVKRVYGNGSANEPNTGKLEQSSSSSKTSVMDKEEAMGMLLKKFSLGEIKSVIEQAKDGLSESEQMEIGNKLESKFTPDELERLKVTALIEIMRRDAAPFNQ